MDNKIYKFTDIIILESLKDKEESTGKKLEVFLKNKFEGKIQITYYDINTKEELYNLFEKMINKSSNGFFPIIHFEIHGHISNMGFILKSNELVNWQYLYIYCKELNFNLNNNLFLTLASCRGAHLMRKVQPFDRCPWGFILGSFKDLWSDEIFRDFSKFYKILLDKKDIELAYQALCKINPNADFEIIDSEQTFLKISKYFEERLKLEKVEKTQGKIMLDAFLRSSTFEKTKQLLNINFNTKILTPEDMINYFSENYILATKSMTSDFKRFFYFWK